MVVFKRAAITHSEFIVLPSSLRLVRPRQTKSDCSAWVTDWRLCTLASPAELQASLFTQAAFSRRNNRMEWSDSNRIGLESLARHEQSSVNSGQDVPDVAKKPVDCKSLKTSAILESRSLL